MRRRQSKPAIWLSVVVLAVAVAGVLRFGVPSFDAPESDSIADVAEKSARRKTEPDSEYVGSQACRSCHRDIAEQYARHPMASSMFRPDQLPDGVEGSRAEFSPVSTRRYVVATNDEQITHHEIGLDADGEQLFDQAFDVCLAIGSGQRGRSYVIEREGGLFLSPISWYSAASRFDLSPGYEGADHKRFSRKAHVRCLHCHSGGVRTEEPTERVEDRFYELEIGCERCHGPGRHHIEWRRQASPERDGDDPIVNPIHLGPVRRDAVCNQCHLQGQTEILRHGRLYTDFRPGELLGETQTIYVHGSGVGSGETTAAVSQTLQMEQSQCYVQSNGRLGCISCHDPHGVPSLDDRDVWYRQKCLSCHDQQGCSLPFEKQQQQPALGSCIVCHMPRLSASDVPHTAQTDHRILARPSAGQPSRKPPRLDDFRVFDLKAGPLPQADHRRAQGMFLAERAERAPDASIVRKAATMLNGLPEKFSGDPELLDRQALMASLSGDRERAAMLWRKSVAIAPDFGNGWYSLAHLARKPEEAISHLNRLIELDPVDVDLRQKRVSVLASIGRMEDAFEDAEIMVSLDPSRSDFREMLAMLAQKTGRNEIAIREARMAGRLKGKPPITSE